MLTGQAQVGSHGELLFAAQAAGKGFGVLYPFGDGHPYDLAIDNGYRILRVQVKTTVSSRTETPDVYRAFVVPKDRNQTYLGRVDVIVVLVPPAETTYLIPTDLIHTKRIALYPHRKVNAGRWEAWREAWHVLGPT